MNSEPILDFVKKYQKIYKNIPVRFTTSGYNYTYLGYDISFYFGNALRVFGNQFPGCLDYYSTKLLLTDYKFKRDDYYTGFYNTSTTIIKYTPEYTIEKVFPEN